MKKEYEEPMVDVVEIDLQILTGGDAPSASVRLCTGADCPKNKLG